MDVLHISNSNLIRLYLLLPQQVTIPEQGGSLRDVSSSLKTKFLHCNRHHRKESTTIHRRSQTSPHIPWRDPALITIVYGKAFIFPYHMKMKVRKPIPQMTTWIQHFYGLKELSSQIATFSPLPSCGSLKCHQKSPSWGTRDPRNRISGGTVGRKYLLMPSSILSPGCLKLLQMYQCLTWIAETSFIFSDLRS